MLLRTRFTVQSQPTTGHEYPNYEPYPGFDRSQDMLFTWRNLVFHIPAYMINTNIQVSEYCILFAQVPVTFIVYKTNHGNYEICLAYLIFSLLKDKTWFLYASVVRRYGWCRHHVCFSGRLLG